MPSTVSDTNNPLKNRYLERYYTSDGLRLRYTDWNSEEEETVILLHGLNVQLHTWNPISEFLNKELRVICPDLRGHGKSDWAKQGYPIEGFVNDLDSLANAIGVQKFSLVGHSLGARIAIAYAGEHSDRLHNLVLSDTGPELPKSAAKSTSNFIGNTNSIKGFRNRDEVRDYYKKVHPEWLDLFIDLHVQHQVRENWAGKLILRSDPELYWITRSAGVKEIPYLWECAAKISVPTLIMFGIRSEFFDDELLARMQAVIKKSDVVKFNTGHYIPREKPEEFAATVLDFVKRNS